MSVKISQSVGCALFCESPGGVTTSCPVGEKYMSGNRPDGRNRGESLQV